MNARRHRKMRESVKMKRCKYCRTEDNLTIDHKIPVILGGTNDASNLQCLCFRCNGIKSGIPDKVFRKILKLGNEINYGNRNKQIPVSQSEESE